LSLQRTMAAELFAAVTGDLALSTTMFSTHAAFE